MAQARERYRRLPGRRRGILRGSSVWLGADHLLLVKSERYREEYKRFYFRDVQAIVVAGARRFHLSTRAISIAILWCLAYLVLAHRATWASTALWTVAAGLVVAWVYISAASSCRCRIYTAVSRDELPSVYRTWTARRFLNVVAPRIWEAQGVLEGGWSEAIEARPVGPVQAVGTPGAAQPESRPRARSHTPSSDIFVALLLADAVFNALTLHISTTPMQWFRFALAAIETGAAIFVFVDRYRGRLRPGMQTLAIVFLLVMGALFYGPPMVSSMSAAAQGISTDQTTVPLMPFNIVVREIGVAASALLGLAGIAITLTSYDEVS